MRLTAKDVVDLVSRDGFNRVYAGIIDRGQFGFVWVPEQLVTAELRDQLTSDGFSVGCRASAAKASRAGFIRIGWDHA